MKFKDGKTISAYVRSKLHSGYITLSSLLASLTMEIIWANVFIAHKNVSDTHLTFIISVYDLSSMYVFLFASFD